MALSAGTRLGPYEILAPLGAGGMGEVYRARDPRLDRDVAIKVLPEGVAREPDRLRRFEREARAAGGLNHPNILVVHDVGTHETRPYVVTELLEGDTLRKRMGGAALPVRKIVDYAVQIARGLAAAHDKGIVHRDLKPENLFVTNDGVVKILDFGLAKLRDPKGPAPDLGSKVETASRATGPGTVMGTVGYMSPEQVRGQAVDHRSDIFSFGAVLYEMLSERRAFQGDTGVEVLNAILKEEPPTISTTGREPPPTLTRIVARCLEKAPEDRYQSARDLAFDLEAASTATVPSPRRRRWLVAGAAAVLALAVGLTVAGLRDTLRLGEPARGPIEAIAVLPLENLSGDPEQGYFVEGMHEALITDLARISGLKRVIARFSVMRYQDTDKPLPEIARELEVEAVITGSVLRAGDRVRVTVQLINAATEEHLWAERYEREVHDVLALHSDVARAVAREVRVALTPHERARLATTRAVDPAAYEDYLKGQYQYSKLTRDGWEAAVSHFQQSIEKDPSYAPAHAMMSFAYHMLGYYGSPTPPAVLHSRALAAAERAVALDDSLAEAHASLAMVKATFDWDWAAADRASQEGLRLNPNSTMALDSRALFLSWMGRHEEAIAIGKRAVKLDPVEPFLNTRLGAHYFMARRYDEAIRQLNEVLALEPGYRDAHNWLRFPYAKKGMYEEAAREEARTSRLGRPSWAGAWILGVAGKPAQARKMFEQIPAEEREVPTDVRMAYLFAAVLGEMGEKDRAFAMLDQAYQGRVPHLSVLKVDPRLDSLRDDPRFEDLLRRMNFPP